MSDKKPTMREAALDVVRWAKAHGYGTFNCIQELHRAALDEGEAPKMDHKCEEGVCLICHPIEPNKPPAAAGHCEGCCGLAPTMGGLAEPCPGVPAAQPAEGYPPDWARVVLMVSPKGEMHAIGGDREPGEGDTPYIGLERIKNAKPTWPKTLAEVQKIIRRVHEQPAVSEEDAKMLEELADSAAAAFMVEVVPHYQDRLRALAARLRREGK